MLYFIHCCAPLKFAIKKRIGNTKIELLQLAVQHVIVLKILKITIIMIAVNHFYYMN